MCQQFLTELINLKHPFVKLAELIDWSVFETRCAEFFPLLPDGQFAAINRGFALPAHTIPCSDEEPVWMWIENSYWQHFCGEICLLLRDGTIIDATLIAAPLSTKNKAGQRDPEMH